MRTVAERGGRVRGRRHFCHGGATTKINGGMVFPETRGYDEGELGGWETIVSSVGTVIAQFVGKV